MVVSVDLYEGNRVNLLKKYDYPYVPDLTIWCPRTQRILLLIEVWDFHPVSRWKAQAYGAAGLPWIEVRASHVLARHRKSPLPVLDWGGPGLPESPHQARVVN